MPKINRNRGYSRGSSGSGGRQSLSEYRQEVYEDALRDGYDADQADQIAGDEAGKEKSRRGQ